MAKNKVNTLDVAKGDDRFDRLDAALGKFSKSGRRGSIIKSAQQNVFEFPAFVSNTIPVDYATATVALLEQLYAAYLQIAVSINPFVDADTAKKGLQFANFKTNTNKYLEYTDTMYQHAICDPVYTEGDVRTSFELVSVEDDTARLINEAMNYEPLSEFDHFWQEAPAPDNSMIMAPLPVIINDPNSNDRYAAADANGNLYLTQDYRPYNEIVASLQDLAGAAIVTRDANGNFTPSLDPTTHHIQPAPTQDRNGMAQHGNVVDGAALLSHYANFVHNNNLSYNPNTVAQTANFNSNVAKNNEPDPAFTGVRGVYNRINQPVEVASNTANLVNNTVNAIRNVATLKDQIANERLKREKTEKDLATYDQVRASQRSDTYGKLASSVKTEYINDAACQKINTMKPLLMKVGVHMLNKDDTIQPIQYIVGVKVHTRMIPSSILPEVAQYPLKEMNKISRKVKWRAGELKFFRDLVFRIKEKKQTAADSRDPNRKWYRRLYELAHMQGDAPSAAVVQGKSLFKTFIDERRGKGKLANGMIPNASIIMTQSDVDNIKSQTGIDLLKGSTAKKFCGELFLISLIIIDTDAQSIKIMLPDMNNDFDVHSIASVEKQLAMLSTAGSKTREIFKLLG